MTNFRIIVLLLFTQICFGQETYKVKEGELQYVTSNFGPVIKKGNKYYYLEFFNYSQRTIGFNLKLSEVSLDELKKIESDSTAITANDIACFDMNTFDGQKYTTKSKVYEFYFPYLYKYNNEVLTIKLKDNNGINHHKTFPFLLLDFGNGKTILYSDEVFIINTNSKFIFLFKDNRLTTVYKNYQTEKLDKTNANELALDSYNPAVINGGLYFTDTIRKRKVIVKNLFGKKVIEKVFDSIKTNGFFIIGYTKKKFELYNYNFKKLDLKGLRAIHYFQNSPSATILQGNEIKRITVLGEKAKKGDILSGYVEPGLSGLDVKFRVIKKEDGFYLESDHVEPLLSKTPKEKFQTFEMLHKIYNREGITEVQYTNDYYESVTIFSERVKKMEYPFLISTKLENGKYNINTIDYLLSEKPNSEVLKENAALPKNLDSLIPKWRAYFIKKNGLVTLFPLVKKIKYKTLENFENSNYFARFELPNGQKGWLSIDGKEYLDESH